MFRKIALGATAALAFVAMASSASAHVASGTYTLSTVGTQRLTVQQSQTLRCTANLRLEVDSTGHAGTITAGTSNRLGAGDLLCPLVTLGLPWAVSIGPVASGSAPITVTGVSATTILGSCTGGTLTGTVSSSGVVNITASSGWTSTPSGTCSVLGAMTLSPVPTLTAP